MLDVLQLSASGIAAAFQLENVIVHAANPQTSFGINKSDVDSLKDVWNKIRDYVPYKFSEVQYLKAFHYTHQEEYCRGPGRMQGRKKNKIHWVFVGDDIDAF